MRYLLLLRRWLWLILTCTLLAALAAFVVSSQTPPIYRASVTLLVQQAPSANISDYTALLTSERLAKTYSQMLTARPVLETVIQALGLNETPAGLANRTKVEPVRDTQLIRLSVEDTDPRRAALLVNAIAEAFITQTRSMQEARYGESLAGVRAQIDELAALIEETQAQIEALGTPETAQRQAESARLETILAGYRNTYATLLQSYEQMRLAAARSVDSVIVFESAPVPSKPVRPRTATNTALAGVVGAMLALGVGFLIEYLDDTIKTPDDVRRALGLGTLGMIGRFEQGEKEVITAARPASAVAEMFRKLRTNLWYSSLDRPLRTVLVTSPGPLEGKSLTAANLSVVMAQAGLRVVIVDADLRRPRLHRLFGVHPRGGLTRSLVEGTTDGRLQSGRVEGLALLPAGELPPNPTEMVGSQRMQELLGKLAERADVVLVDSPPILPVADATVLAREVDGVVLVVEVGKTRRAAAQQAVESLQQVGANVLGVVLNGVPGRGGGYYYYYYYGRYDDHYCGDGSGRRRGKHRERKGPLARMRRRASRGLPPAQAPSPDPSTIEGPAIHREPPPLSSPLPPVSSCSRWGTWIWRDGAWKEDPPRNSVGRG